VQHVSWHWVFFINLPLAAAVCLISLLHVPESINPNAGRVDWAGAIAATLGLGGVIYGLLESATLGWRSPYVYGSLAGGTFGLVVFIFIEMRAISPMVPLGLFEITAFRAANVLTLFLYAAVGIFFFLFPLNLIQVQGYSPTATGAAALPFILLMFALSRWSGGLVARYGARVPLMVGPSIVALGFLLTTVVMSSVEQQRAGTASGINNAVARVAGVLAIAVLGIVMTWCFHHRLDSLLTGLNLPADAVQSIKSNSIKLAGMDVPGNLDAKTASALQSAVRQSFIFGFRMVMVICALLALASAITGRALNSDRAGSSPPLSARAA
jgi:hypothetical protein